MSSTPSRPNAAGAVATSPSGTTHLADPADEPLGALVHRMTQQIPELVRSELRLGQAELTEKGKSAGIGVGLFSTAGLVALYGLAGLLATTVIALDLVLPLWLAALVVTVVLFGAAGVTALIGKRKVEEAGPPVPERAIAGVKEDVATVKGEHTP
jgi:uncharacterized membrane protein YqjE